MNTRTRVEKSVDAPVDKFVDKRVGNPRYQRLANDPTLQAYAAQWAAKLSRLRADRMASCGVVAAVQVEQEILAAIEVGRIECDDITPVDIEREHARIVEMLRHTGRARDAPALLVANVRRMVRTGLIPKYHEPPPQMGGKACERVNV